MADPVGGTTFSNDGWEERAMRRVASRQKGSQRSTERKHGMYLFFDDDFRIFLDEAAQRRNISMTGYMRRAVAAMVAHDLGIPYEAVVRHSAQPTTYNQTSARGPQKKTFDDGQGHGVWAILQLK